MVRFVMDIFFFFLSVGLDIIFKCWIGYYLFKFIIYGNWIVVFMNNFIGEYFKIKVGVNENVNVWLVFIYDVSIGEI